MAGRGRASWLIQGGLALTLPLSLYLLAFLLLPLGIFAVISFWDVQGYDLVPAMTVRNYTAAVTDEIYRAGILRSLGIGAISATVAVAAAYPIAYFIAFRAGRNRDLLLFLVLVAIFGNYLVRVYAWRSILSTNGLLDTLLVGTGLVREHTSYLLYSPVATTVALANVYLPFAVLPIYASLLNIRPLVVEAARDLGASSLRAIAEIVLPLSRPGLTAAFVMLFFITTADFVTPELVGGSSGSMIGSTIQAQFGTNFNWPLGSALAFATLAAMVIALGAAAVGGRLLRSLSGRLLGRWP